MKLKNEFYFMRHGEAENNVHHILSDLRRAYPLTAHGRQLVQQAARALKPHRLTRIYVSPVRRAHETGLIVARTVGAPLKVVRDLREVEFGPVFDNHFVSEFEHSFPSFLKRFEKGPPGGETYEAIQRRMVAAFHRLDGAHSDARILIVSHGDPLWLLESALRGRSRALAVRRRFATYYRTAEVRNVEPYGNHFRFRSLVNGRK